MSRPASWATGAARHHGTVRSYGQAAGKSAAGGPPTTAVTACASTSAPGSCFDAFTVTAFQLTLPTVQESILNHGQRPHADTVHIIQTVKSSFTDILHYWPGATCDRTNACQHVG
jgi:hypothetical protein